LNLRNLWTQIGWTFATRLLMIFNSLAAGIIVAHWLGAEGVGQLAVINVAIATIVQLGSFGLPSSTTYFIAQNNGHLRGAAVNSLIFALGVGALLALGLSAGVDSHRCCLNSISTHWFDWSEYSVGFGQVA
jgi:O-antigen/teichoic acid export membrane protein